MPYNVRASIGKRKGQFVKIKVKRAIEAAKDRLLKTSDKKNSNSGIEHNLEGRRIVELDTLGEQLTCKICNSTLSLRDVQSERRSGFASTLKVSCARCGNSSAVRTNKLNSQDRLHNVNLKAATAIVDAGIGQTQMNTICSSMNIPSVSASLLKRHERIVDPVAMESFAAGIKLEEELIIDSDSGEP